MAQGTKKKSQDELYEELNNQFALCGFLWERAKQRYKNKELSDDEFQIIKNRLLIEIDKLEARHLEIQNANKNGKTQRSKKSNKKNESRT